MGEREQVVVDGVAEYAELIDQGSRTSARARLLVQLDELGLVRSDELITRRVDAAALASEPILRGAIELQLDLMFRASVNRAEIRSTARNGLVFVAMHPDVPALPVAVVLAAGANRLIERRAELFDDAAVGGGAASHVLPFALAASPAGLGAGRCVLRSLIACCAGFPAPPRVTTFSPLTGLRAHVIRCVDEPPAWRESLERHPGIDARALQGQLLALLSLDVHPDRIDDPARSWLAKEAAAFAASDRFAVGTFHRAMGAVLTGTVEHGDRVDSDAMWWRAWFDYGPAAVM